MEAIAKIILFGEHSVVYGKRALAIPIRELKIRVKKTKEKCFQNDYVEYIKNLLNIKEYIKIKSNIPISRGLGSSAALPVAMSRLVGADENKIAKIAEIKAHGNPSGIDSSVICSEKSLIFEKGKENIYINTKLEGYITIIDSGIQSSTKKAVEQVRMLNRIDIIDKLGEITEEAIKSYYDKKIYKLGELFYKAQEQLVKLGLSNERIDILVKKAKYNSLGVKITGSGMGGCIIALCKNKKQAIKLKKEMKKEGVEGCWIVRV